MCAIRDELRLLHGVTLEGRMYCRRRAFSAIPTVKDDRYLSPFLLLASLFIFHFVLAIRCSFFLFIFWGSYFPLFGFAYIVFFVLGTGCTCFASVIINFPIFVVSLFGRLVRDTVGSSPWLRLFSPSPCFFPCIALDCISSHCHFSSILFHDIFHFP